MKFNRPKSALLRHTVDVSGTCSECGHDLSKKIRFDVIGNLFNCDNCCIANYVHYYKNKDFTDHKDFLTEQLRNSNRIVFIGLNKSVIRYDLFNIDYDNSVLGLIDP